MGWPEVDAITSAGRWSPGISRPKPAAALTKPSIAKKQLMNKSGSNSNPKTGVTQIVVQCDLPPAGAWLLLYNLSYGVVELLAYIDRARACARARIPLLCNIEAEPLQIQESWRSEGFAIRAVKPENRCGDWDLIGTSRHETCAAKDEINCRRAGYARFLLGVWRRPETGIGKKGLRCALKSNRRLMAMSRSNDSKVAREKLYLLIMKSKKPMEEG
jgi:hypothetical protein